MLLLMLMSMLRPLLRARLSASESFVLRWSLAAFLVFYFSPVVAEPLNFDSSVEVIKSSNDQRHYQYLLLPNQLRVLLISDPTTDKAAAAMDVGVGSYDDPQERQGLAHFLEHMLFLGTEKYPEADAYQSFIVSKGGSHNAYTSAEHTNYFFDVEYSHLEQTLDRFAQFFIAPLFTPEYIDRERHAVHSEFRSKYKNSYRRQLDVLRQVVRPQHPMSKFSVGSLETLDDREGSSLKEGLLAFYQDHYSSSNMTLVVLGRESLGDLKSMVEQRFSDIPLRTLKPTAVGERLYSAESLPQKVLIQSLKDERRMTLSFAVPSVDGLYHKKPLQYLGNLLGHEGNGSLYSLLKELGLAEGLSAGGQASGRHEGAFDISILLTEKGYQNYEKVAAITFKMIEKIQSEGVEKWRFREQKKLSDIGFQFLEKGEPIHTVSRLANQMHEYTPEDTLRGGYAFDDYDSRLIGRYAKYLQPENLTMVLTAPDVETDQVSPIYAVPFSRQLLNVNDITLKRGELRQLDLPRTNRFIPDRLEVKKLEEPAAVDSVPRLIKSTQNIDLWFKQDDSFYLPKGEILIRAYSPVVGPTVESAALSHLYATLVEDALNEYSYPAYLAGLSFALRANSRGFDLSLSGYNDRQGLLLSRILDVIDHPRFTLERYESLRSELVRSWRNQSRLTPYEQIFRKLPALLYSPMWDQSELADALERSTFKQLKEFSNQAWMGTEIQMLVYGNFFHQDALKLATVVENHLFRPPEGVDAEVVPARVIDLATGVKRYHLEVDHKDVAAVFYQQALGDSFQDRAAMLMLRQMLRASFFHQLRTEQQLGYVVFVSGLDLKDVSGNVFVVQSPASSLNTVMSAIKQFIEESVGVVTDFDNHRRAVLAELTQTPKNFGEQADRYWSEILADQPNFDRRSRLVSALENLTPEQLRDYSLKSLGQVQGLWLTAAPEDEAENLESSTIKIKDAHFEVLKANLKVYTYP